MRYLLDRSYERFGPVVLAGSPLRLFRLGPAGVAVVEGAERGDDVEPSPLLVHLADAGALHPRPRPGRFSAADVTVVRPVLARSPLDAGALTAADAHRTVVVDDASPVEVIGATVRLDCNRGPAAARNAGLALVDTALVAFVDADVVLHPGWLDMLLGHFDDDRVALVAPRIRSVGGHGRLARYERTGSPLDLGDEPAQVRPGTRVSYVPAATVVCRTDAIRSLGGFDEALRFGEDVDLVWRLHGTGAVCRYEPGVSVGHRSRDTWAGWVRQRIGYGSSAGPLSLRHPGALAPARMSGWSVAAWVLVLAAHPTAGVAVTASTAAALAAKLRGVPPRRSFGLAALGTWRAGRSLADATRRAWFPLVAIAALKSRGARRAALLSLLAAGHPLKAADDLAYCAGVWRGMWAGRTLAPLVPDITAWPPRRGGR
jgi:mycofactocin glycosyltransferase